jgi:catechol 2,3-dioxygenase-like lactoylglutathione lyase family enzyme
VSIDHLGLAVADLPKSQRFYEQALAPLGIRHTREVGGWAGFGKDKRESFWLGRQTSPGQPQHVAFAAESRDEVRAFYEAALAAGAKPNKPPQLLDIYHRHFFAAMVFDLDGNNVEAVCHVPDQGEE